MTLVMLALLWAFSLAVFGIGGALIGMTIGYERGARDGARHACNRLEIGFISPEDTGWMARRDG